MELAYSDKEIAFQDEVRSFFTGNLPAETVNAVRSGSELTKKMMVEYHALLAKKEIGRASCRERV